MESARKGLEETQYVAQNARSRFTKSAVRFGVDWKLYLVFKGLVAETISQKLFPIKLNGDSLECVDKFCYLGDMRHDRFRRRR